MAAGRSVAGSRPPQLACTCPQQPRYKEPCRTPRGHSPPPLPPLPPLPPPAHEVLSAFDVKCSLSSATYRESFAHHNAATDTRADVRPSPPRGYTQGGSVASPPGDGPGGRAGCVLGGGRRAERERERVVEGRGEGAEGWNADLLAARACPFPPQVLACGAGDALPFSSPGFLQTSSSVSRRNRRPHARDPNVYHYFFSVGFSPSIEI